MYACEVGDDGRLIYLVEDWQNSEYVPVIVDEFTSDKNFPFPIKLFRRPKNWSISRSLIAVRCDVYPLWWVYVWLHFQAENLSSAIWFSFMRRCNQLGIAKTEPGCMYSWKDFWGVRAMKSDRGLRIISQILAGITAISWSISEYPYVGLLWLLLWGWVQWRMWSEERERERVLKHFEVQLQALETARRASQSDKPITTGKNCTGCKYFFGGHGIVCAVHPRGYEGEFCVDRELR